jgi:glycosyltransferase involved in cell wall biosynthesis
MKKTILHFIYRLGRGGAEIMLVRVVQELPEYNNIIVEMYGDNAFGKELQCDKYISMNLKSNFSLPLAILKLRRIIIENKVDIVHTHLFWPTAIARIATPIKIPLITTIHTSVSAALDYKLWRIRVIDRITYRLRKSIIIGVSNTALKDYFTFLNLKPFRSYLLNTFVDVNRFNVESLKKIHPAGKFLIVSVGALRAGKNYEYLIKAFEHLNFTNVELHIYGTGPLEKQLQQMIGKSNVPVILKGEVTNINELLPLYDLYVSASAFEGFSLAILEAMAMKLPLLLSDIPSFKEQCENTAIYFNLESNKDFSNKLTTFMNDAVMRNDISEKGYQRVLKYFTLPDHVAELQRIYNETFSDAK